MATMKTVSVTATMGGGMKIDSDIRGHQVCIDQPAAAGGTDAGPTPLEFLFFSLAGCIASIGRIVASQKRLDIRGMTVDVSGELDLEGLLGKSKENRVGFQGFTVRVSVDADMSDEEKLAFVEEVDARCPVSENLGNPTAVKVELA